MKCFFRMLPWISATVKGSVINLFFSSHSSQLVVIWATLSGMKRILLKPYKLNLILKCVHGVGMSKLISGILISIVEIFFKYLQSQVIPFQIQYIQSERAIYSIRCSPELPI